MTSSLQPSPHEVELSRRYWVEYLALLGFPARLYFPVNLTRSGNSDPSPSPPAFKPPIEVKIGFEDIPTVKVLKRLGWFAENEATLPQIAHLPYYYQDDQQVWQSIIPVRDMVIEVGYGFTPNPDWVAPTLPSARDLVEDGLATVIPAPIIPDDVSYTSHESQMFRKFVVTEVSVVTLVAFGWTLKLAPYRHTIEPGLPTDQSYVRIEEGEGDDPDVTIVEPPVDGNYRYLTVEE